MGEVEAILMESGSSASLESWDLAGIEGFR